MRSPTTDLLGACCAVVGLDLAIRAYPAGDPVRDRAHTALLERLRAQLHPTLTWRTEVPLPLELDLRAWDAQIGGVGWRVRVEAEMRIDDGQALERRLALKVRDGGEGHVVVLVAETRANRAALVALRPHLRALLPLDTRAILTALRAGRDPGGNGIVML